jgi:hypothetical protein
MSGKGNVYDCEPLQKGELEQYFAATGFQYQNRGVVALRTTFEIECADAATTKLLRWIPDGAIRLFGRIIPTLIYRFCRNS